MNFITRNLKSSVLKAVSKNGLELANASEKLKDDKQVVTFAIRQNAQACKYMSDRLANDERFIYSLAKENIEVLSNLHNETATKVLQRLRDESKYKVVDESKVFNDKMVIDSIEKVKWALNFTSGAVVLDRATDELKDDIEAVLICVRDKGHALYYASSRLQDTREVVMEAVKQDGLSLMSASDRLKDDDEIVKTAISNYGYALRFASARLRNERDMVHLACKIEPWAIMYASAEIRNDVNFVYDLAQYNKLILTKVPKRVAERVTKRLIRNGLWRVDKVALEENLDEEINIEQ